MDQFSPAGDDDSPSPSGLSAQILCKIFLYFVFFKYTATGETIFFGINKDLSYFILSNPKHNL